MIFDHKILYLIVWDYRHALGMRRLRLQLITFQPITLHSNILQIQFSLHFYSLHTISYTVRIFSLFHIFSKYFANLVFILISLDKKYLFFDIY